jgi:hypothetical protein
MNQTPNATTAMLTDTTITPSSTVSRRPTSRSPRMLLSQGGRKSVVDSRPVMRSKTRSSLKRSFPNTNIVIGIPKIMRM